MSNSANSWQSQLKGSYQKPADLLADLGFSTAEINSLLDKQNGTFSSTATDLFAMRVPRAFVQKMQPRNQQDPLLLQVMPQRAEWQVKSGFSQDPLNEKGQNPAAGLLHKYQSRVLLTLRGACAVNCRYCFRRHFAYADNRINESRMQEILAYISKNPQVNEVILSGGDPLMARDDVLLDLVQQLATLPQLKRLRIHSRLPVMIAERLTPALCELLTSTSLKPVLVLHINHPNEIDTNLAKHLAPFQAAGVLLLNQAVLLKAVNDRAEVLVALSEKLFSIGVLPYYLFLLDKVAGAAHFDISETQAKALIKTVAAALPGYLVPKLTREVAGMPSKDMWLYD